MLTSIGEAGGQNEHIVLSPLVREDDALGDFQELLHVPLELPLAALELIGTGNNLAARANGGSNDITRGNGEQVRRDWDLLLKLIDLLHAGSGSVVANRNTAGNNREGGRELEANGGLDIRSVLAGEDGASIDGLALREHVRVLLVGRLSGRQPLKGSALAGRLQLNSQVDDIALGRAIGNLHMQRCSKGIRVRLQLPLGLSIVDVDGRDVDEARVEDDLLALLVGLALQLQHNGSLEALILKVNVEVGGGVPCAPSAVVGQGSGIASASHGVVDCCKAPP